ncbi:MAG: glycosyltransferase family 4 protein [Phycisphaerae bacterium]|nr:glycosyltransferase family 4 protein [Phycisphaerae bacterium]
MKTAIVIEHMEAWRGGAETSTMELARLLTERGHDIHMVTSTTAPSTPGSTIHQIPTGTTLRPLRTLTFVRKATEFLQRDRFDVVLAISPVACADVYQPRGGLLGESMERNVATRPTATRRMMKRALMAMNFKRQSLLELERRIFRRDGPLIAAVSRYVARQCKRFYGADSRRVRVVFNGVNANSASEDERAAARAELRAQYHINDDTLLLLFIAHNFRLKGLYPLIETISRLVVSGFTDFRLLVLGRDNPTRYQRRLDALELTRFVTFAGPTQRTTSFYHAADVCVHPTYFDPCSRVVLEALWLGVPCITTSFNGASEVIRDGIEGFVIDTPDNVGLWARRIDELRSPELRRKMSERATSLRDRISMRRHVEELDAVLTEAAERRHDRCRTV